MLKDYYSSCKPRVVLLLLITAVIGMLLASPNNTFPSIHTIFFATIGIGLSACSAAVFNQIIETSTDQKMQRTKERPIAAGKIIKRKAIIFATSLGIIGVAILYFIINKLTAYLTLLTIIGYAVFYTSYLKKTTPQNIVIGGIAGATPPLLGWVAVTNEIDPYALQLVIIIYTWTPPHFWALAVAKKSEYAKSGLPMLPITHGVEFTKINIILYTILTLVATLLPYLTGITGVIYLFAALILGMIFLITSIMFYYKTEEKWGLILFKYSIFYLFFIFIFLLIDHYI